MIEPQISLHLFFASQTPRALVLLRKRKALYRLIVWDRDTDRFQPGQWLCKQMHADACILSPDGQHFLYTVKSANPNADRFGNYVAVSSPPYFTAHMLFPNAYGWGARFLDNGLVQLQDAQARDHFGSYTAVQQAVPGAVTKDCKTGLRQPNGQPVRLSRALRDALLSDEAPSPQPNPLDRFETQGGALFRLEGGARREIADFTDMEFEPIKAPYTTPTNPKSADADGGSTGWHPMDSEI